MNAYQGTRLLLLYFTNTWWLLVIVPAAIAIWTLQENLRRETSALKSSPVLYALPTNAIPPTPGTAPNGPAVEVGDLLNAAQTPEGRQCFEGKDIELEGQVMPLGPERFQISRLLMRCCAADAKLLSVRVDGTCDLPPLKWARVSGEVHFLPKNWRPVVTARKITSIPQPANPFVYRGDEGLPNGACCGGKHP